jgi:hypothetical protein
MIKKLPSDNKLERIQINFFWTQTLAFNDLYQGQCQDRTDRQRDRKAKRQKDKETDIHCMDFKNPLNSPKS